MKTIWIVWLFGCLGMVAAHFLLELTWTGAPSWPVTVGILTGFSSGWWLFWFLIHRGGPA